MHGWIDGHPHEPYLNADMGDWVSMLEHAFNQSRAVEDGEVTMLFDSGDFVDGTGLSNGSPIPGQYIFPVLQHVPFQGLTPGNHDLEHTSTVEFMNKPGGFLKGWSSGQMMTSNIKWRSNDTRLADAYTVANVTVTATGEQLRVLSLGFIYDFLQGSNLTKVTFVNDSVLEPYFEAAMSEPDIDIIVIPAHIDPSAGVEMEQLFHAVRKYRPHTALLLLTGHRHIEYFKQLDENAYTMESGRYFEIFGVLEFDMDLSVRKQGLQPRITGLSHKFVPTNVDVMRQIVDVPASDFVTEEGYKVKALLKEFSSRLNLNETYGCAPATFNVTQPASDPSGLFYIYVNEIPPMLLYGEDHPYTPVFLTNSAALRYPIFRGPVTKNDILTTVPFNDTFRYVAPIYGSDLTKAVAILRKEAAPAYEMSLDEYEDETLYRIVAARYDLFTLANVLSEIHTRVPFDMGPIDTNITSTQALQAYADVKWPCHRL